MCWLTFSFVPSELQDLGGNGSEESWPVGAGHLLGCHLEGGQPAPHHSLPPVWWGHCSLVMWCYITHYSALYHLIWPVECTTGSFSPLLSTFLYYYYRRCFIHCVFKLTGSEWVMDGKVQHPTIHAPLIHSKDAIFFMTCLKFIQPGSLFYGLILDFLFLLTDHPCDLSSMSVCLPLTLLQVWPWLLSLLWCQVCVAWTTGHWWPCLMPSWHKTPKTGPMPSVMPSTPSCQAFLVAAPGESVICVLWLTITQKENILYI